MSSDTDEPETTVMMDDPTCSEPEESDSSSESNFRKKRRLSRYENYVHGTARGGYQLRSKDLETTMDLSPTIEGVCSACTSGLSGIASGFQKLKHQGTELKKGNKNTDTQVRALPRY